MFIFSQHSAGHQLPLTSPGDTSCVSADPPWSGLRVLLAVALLGAVSPGVRPHGGTGAPAEPPILTKHLVLTPDTKVYI